MIERILARIPFAIGVPIFAALGCGAAWLLCWLIGI
jgi:hypothetical protein